MGYLPYYVIEISFISHKGLKVLYYFMKPLIVVTIHKILL